VRSGSRAGAVSYTQARILDLVGLGDIEPLVTMHRTARVTIVELAIPSASSPSTGNGAGPSAAASHVASARWNGRPATALRLAPAERRFEPVRPSPLRSAGRRDGKSTTNEAGREVMPGLLLVKSDAVGRPETSRDGVRDRMRARESRRLRWECAGWRTRRGCTTIRGNASTYLWRRRL